MGNQLYVTDTKQDEVHRKNCCFFFTFRLNGLIVFFKNEQNVQEAPDVPNDPEHPLLLIPELLKLFYQLDWVTGTGGGISIRKG
jgi:hypothetical protein